MLPLGGVDAPLVRRGSGLTDSTHDCLCRIHLFVPVFSKWGGRYSAPCDSASRNKSRPHVVRLFRTDRIDGSRCQAENLSSSWYGLILRSLRENLHGAFSDLTNERCADFSAHRSSRQDLVRNYF